MPESGSPDRLDAGRAVCGCVPVPAESSLEAGGEPQEGVLWCRAVPRVPDCRSCKPGTRCALLYSASINFESLCEVVFLDGLSTEPLSILDSGSGTTILVHMMAAGGVCQPCCIGPRVCTIFYSHACIPVYPQVVDCISIAVR